MFSGRDDPPTKQLALVDETGEVVARRYRLITPLGKGGFGVVWKARDQYLGDQEVALKFLPPSLAGDVLAQTDFKREAQVAMSLAHPQLVRLHCMDQDVDQPFLVMEFLRGPTLSEILAQRGRLAPEEVRAIGAQVCEGLAHAHSEGVVHLDLKPSNLMLSERLPSPEALLCDPAVRVKVTDFGIARVMIDTTSRLGEQPLAGTLAYVSPEMIRGRGIDHRADIYSLGCVLYHLVSGRRPFQGPDLTHQHLNEAPQRIVDCPDELWKIIATCLEKEKSERFQSAADLAVALRGESRSSARRRFQIAAVVTALAAGLAAGALWTSTTHPHADPPIEQAQAPVETAPAMAMPASVPDKPVADVRQMPLPEAQEEPVEMVAETIPPEKEPLAEMAEMIPAEEEPVAETAEAAPAEEEPLAEVADAAPEPEPLPPAEALEDESSPAVTEEVAPIPESPVVVAEGSDHSEDDLPEQLSGEDPEQPSGVDQGEESEALIETSVAAEEDTASEPSEREVPRSRARRAFTAVRRGVRGAVVRIGEDLYETVTDIHDYMETE